MSHPLYNPRGGSFSGGQRPMMSGQFGLGTQSSLDLGASRMGPTPGTMPGPRGGMMSPMVSQQMGFPLTQRPSQMSQDLDASIDRNIQGAREEVRLLAQMIQQQQQPKQPDPRLRKETREEVLSTGGGFQGSRGPGRSDEPLVEWSSYQTPSKLFAAPNMGQASNTSQLFPATGFASSSGLGSGGLSSQAPPEHHPGRYTSESASSILASFGLSNEDLELLSHYPDDQLTPDNLPFILRDIRIRKAKRSVPDMRPSSDLLGSDPRQSKVIDYGHSSKFGISEENPDGYKRDHLMKESPTYGREVSRSPFGGADISKRPPPSQPVLTPGPSQSIQKPPAMDLRTAVPSADLKSSKALPGRHAVPQPIHPPVSRPAPPSSHAVGSLGTISDVPASTKPIWPHVFPPPLSNPLNTKRLPTPTLMNDYSAATPRIFPHTCSLCNIECVLIKDWIEHQNTNQHIESCRRLRKQYPDWNVETVTVTRNEPKLEPRSPKRRTRSHSYSRTPSPRRHHGSSGRRLRSRSRSRSPRKHRRTRSHSRSRSPRRSSRASPPQYRRRSRTPPRQRSRSPGYGRRSPVRSGRRVSPRRISPRRISPRRMSPRRVGPPRHQRSSSERLAMKLLESSAELSSITDSNALKAMVQSLAPALLAELAKKKSNSSSSSMTGSSSRKSSFPPSSKKNEASISSGSSTPKTTSSSKTVKPKKKASPGTACLLKITGVPFGTTHTELEEAVKPFGKLHTAVLLKAIGEASVCMASEEDAKALVNCKDLKLHGKVVQVSMEKAIQEDLKETPPAVKKPTVKKKLASVIKLPLAGKAKPQPVKAKPSQPSKVKPTAKSTEATPVLKKVVKREIPWRKNVLEISGLPVGVTEDDLTKLAQPHGFNTVPVIAITQNKAYLEMPDKKAAEAMVNAYSETPVKVQETEISIKMMTQPIDLKYTESVFRVLMGMEKSPEFVTLPERLLTVNNVPKGSTAITEVQELIKRFGAYKQSLPLNNRIIFEMETAAIARTLHSRFLKFPCIVQNNSLSFTLAKVPKSIDEVKKKPVPKRPGAGAKSDEMRKKGPAAGAKPAVALAKAKMAKGQTPGAAAAKAANSNVNAKPKESVMTPKAAPPGETVTGNALVVDTSARSTTAPAPANAVSITATSGDSEGPVSRDAPTETGAKMKDCDTTPGVGDEMKTAATTEAEAADSCAEDGAKMETAASTDAAFSEAEAKMDPQDNNSTEAGAQKDSLDDAQNETQMDSKVALEVDSAPATSELTKIALDNKGGLNSENGPDTALRLSTENLSAEQGKNNEVQEGQAKDTVVPASSVHNESTATVASSGELMETQIAPVKETTKGAEVKQGDVIVTEPLKILADPPKVDDQTLDFPPITQEILKALEAAVHQCRMQSSLRSAEDQARQEQGSTEKTLNKHKAPGPKRLAATNSKTFQKSNASTPKSVKGKKLATAGVKGHSGISSSPDRESFSRHRSRAGSEEEQVPSTPRGGSSSSSSTTSQRSKRESSPVSMRSKERKSHRSSGTTRSRSDSRRKEEKKVEEMEEMSDFPFNLDEFVTVDEVGDEVAEESVVQEPSPKRKRHQDSKKTTTVSSTPKSQKPLPPTPKAKQVKKPTVRKTRSVAAAEAVVQEAKDDAAEIKVVERADCKPISKVGEIQKKEEKEPQKTSPEAAITAQSNQITLEETPSCGKEKTSCGAGEPTAVPPAGQGGCSATRMLTAEAPSLHVDCADSRLSDQSSSSKSEPHPLPAHPEPPHPAAEDRPLELAGKTKRVVMDKAAQRPPDPNNLVSLDEVSEEEEDYPDDEAEEELLRRQAGEDPEALVTVDEVGDDEEHLEKDLQGLVTLDEIVGEDEDEGNPDEELGDIFNPETLVTLDEAKGDDEDEVGEAKNPSPDVVHSALVEGARGSLSHDEEVQDLEVLRRMNFVTVDEVGEEEEEQSNEKEKKQQEETPTSRGRRPKKSTRQTPVRKSLRGKRGLGKAPKEPEEAVEEQATPAPPVPVDTCPGTEPSGLGSELHSDKAEVATGLPGPDVPTSGQEEDVGIQDHGSESSRSSDCKGEAITEKRRTIKEGSKQRRVASEKQELEAKRAHSHLPMDQDFTLPPFNPDSPVGVDFVVPKTGYFCKLCSLFYGSEDTAKRSHCSSLRHYQNMEKYYKKLKSQQRDGNCS